MPRWLKSTDAYPDQDGNLARWWLAGGYVISKRRAYWTGKCFYLLHHKQRSITWSRYLWWLKLYGQWLRWRAKK